jgi:hypothetical protein
MQQEAPYYLVKSWGPPIHGSLSPDWGSGISTCCQFCNNNANSTLVDWHYTGLLMQVNWPSRVNFSTMDTKTNSENFGKNLCFLV